MSSKKILISFWLLILSIFGIWKFLYDDISITKLDTYTYLSEPDSYLSKSTGTQVTSIKVEDKKYDIEFDYNIYWNELENKSYRSVLEDEIKRMDYVTPARVYEEMLYVWQWWWMLKTIDMDLSWDIEDTMKKYVDSLYPNKCDLVKNPWLKYFTWYDYMVYWYDLSDYSFDNVVKCPYLYQNKIPYFIYDKRSPNKVLLVVVPNGIGGRWDESRIGTLIW